MEMGKPGGGSRLGLGAGRIGGAIHREDRRTSSRPSLGWRSEFVSHCQADGMESLGGGDGRSPWTRKGPVDV